MAEVIGVRFKEVGKVYYFDPIGNKLSAGDKVIVDIIQRMGAEVEVKDTEIHIKSDGNLKAFDLDLSILLSQS